MNSPTYLGGALFMKAYRLLRTGVAESLAQYELTPTLWILLGVVKAAPEGVRKSEIAAVMNVKAPLITILTQQLIERDLLASDAHVTDKRAKVLVLTEEGARFTDEVEASVSELLMKVLSGATSSDMEVFKKVLTIIVENAEV
jgi:DNA-binding MarR family transcriptional regulator